MDNENKKTSCKDCNELLNMNKTETVGKCLRDSQYKDPNTDNCAFMSPKNTK